MVYLEGICMVEADTHVVWDQFNTVVPKAPAFCSRGRTTKESCEVEIRGGWPLLMWKLLFWYPCIGACQRHHLVVMILVY